MNLLFQRITFQIYNNYQIVLNRVGLSEQRLLAIHDYYYRYLNYRSQLWRAQNNAHHYLEEEGNIQLQCSTNESMEENTLEEMTDQLELIKQNSRNMTKLYWEQSYKIKKLREKQLRFFKNKNEEILFQMKEKSYNGETEELKGRIVLMQTLFKSLHKQ